MKSDSIIKPLSVAVNYSAVPNNVEEAKYVYCGNTQNETANNDTRFVAVRNASGTLISTVMIGANNVIIIEKERTDVVHGCTGVSGAIKNFGNVVFTKVSIDGQA